MPNGDRAQAGERAETEGGAVGYIAEHGHRDARTWHAGELWNAASSLRLSSSALLSSETWRHSREYALLVGIIISLLFLLKLCVPICRISRGTHRTTLLRTRTRRRPSGHLGPRDLSSECLVVVYWTYYTYRTIFYVMDLCYVSDSCYVLDL